jgi:hypothetical protein
MPGEKAGRVIAGRSFGWIGAMAVETLGTHMTTLARLRPAVGHRPMDLGKILAV